MKLRKLERESDGFEERMANLKFPAKANAECHLKSNNVSKKIIIFQLSFYQMTRLCLCCLYLASCKDQKAVERVNVSGTCVDKVRQQIKRITFFATLSKGSL